MRYCSRPPETYDPAGSFYGPGGCTVINCGGVAHLYSGSLVNSSHRQVQRFNKSTIQLFNHFSIINRVYGLIQRKKPTKNAAF
jgi:hypothetical protein